MQMVIRTIPVELINPAPYNPRKDLQPGDPEYEKLRRSVEEFGLVEVLVWNQQTGNLVGGHQRFKVLKEQGVKEVTVSVVNFDEAKEKALNIALNKISGDWDLEKLSVLLFELEDTGLSNLTGFDDEEIAELRSTFVVEDTPVDDPVVDDAFDVQGALESISEPETQYGDIWQLGRHLLMCGDATKIADVQKLMGGERAHLVVTDPPYNVAFESDSTRLAAEGLGSIMNDDMPMEQFKVFLDEVFTNYAAIMEPTAAIYIFHPSAYQREFENAMNRAGIVSRTQCVWVKNVQTFGFAQYRFKHEPVFYAHLKGKAPAWYGDRKQTTVWRNGLPVELPQPETVWEVSKGDVSKYVHPTQKPLDLLAIPIGNSSQRGDIVVDLFGGSGSTLMTCEQMGRECRTMELDPRFCDVIKKRYYEATDIQPVLVTRRGA